MKPTVSSLSMLVVKTGVMLGGLSEAQRQLALAVAAAAIPVDVEHSEAQVNTALKRCLTAETAFLDTDHVELRRWLVDTGWWQRDGFGRAYRRRAADDLPAVLQPMQQALAGLDLPAWVAAEQARAMSARADRRAAWAQQRGQQRGQQGGQPEQATARRDA